MIQNKSTQGILLMVAAVALLTLMSVLVKVIGPDYHPTQITFVRNLIAMAVILPFIYRAGGLAIMKTRRPGLHLTRSLAGTAGNILYFFAFQYMTVGDVVVISQAVPLFVTILAVLFLGEQVGVRRWLSILVGFAGVIIAINPAGNFTAISLIAVLATGCWATTLLLMRRLGTTESPYAVAFYFMLIGSIITACFQPWVWRTPSPDIMLLLLGIGISGALGQILMTTALKLAKASVVSPFSYTGILWAVGFDLIIWNVIPAWTTVLGAVIISASGLYIFHRESIARAISDEDREGKTNAEQKGR